jgi:hypothetical protein
MNKSNRLSRFFLYKSRPRVVTLLPSIDIYVATCVASACFGLDKLSDRTVSYTTKVTGTCSTRSHQRDTVD